MKRETPYVHIAYAGATRVESGAFAPSGVVYRTTAGYHALFAARVMVEPYELLAQRKWGWTDRDLLDEVLDRQRRFIASLHDAGLQSVLPNIHLRTVALRYVASGDSRQIDVILVGKAFASGPEQAGASALTWYEEIEALVPRDYSLAPLTSEQEFMRQSGQELLETPSIQVVEVRRFETFQLRAHQQAVMETDYLVYPFLWHRHGMEQVWQAMASQQVPSVVSVTLRPTYLYEAEEFHLARLYQAATETVMSENVAGRILGEQAASIYADYLRSWKQPFLVRVQIIAPQRIPGALARATGCAFAYGTLTGSGQEEFPFPGYELAVPDEEERTVVRENVCLLEINDWGHDQAAAPYRRFRYLTDARGAQCTFRLPFVPKKGIPGVLMCQQADLETPHTP